MADAVRLGKPFFVQISHHAPRKPIETRQATLTEWSNTALHPPGQRHKDPEYAAMLADMDVGLGILFDKIKSLGIDSNTYIAVETPAGGVQKIPLASLSAADAEYAQKKIGRISQINGLKSYDKRTDKNRWALPGVLGILTLFSIVLTFLVRQKGFSVWGIAVAALGLQIALFTLFSFGPRIQAESLTDPLFIESAFRPFKPKIATSWDDKYFYVSSLGLPSHNMMVGITKWQQQVPIPQCYVGSNAWPIPLNPELSNQPLAIEQHFMKGAVAIAVNGIPIFNARNNTGLDSYLAGELDSFGGHCGRADDYHYHIAPLHLEGQSGGVLPIGFALDGYALYGRRETVDGRDRKSVV